VPARAHAPAPDELPAWSLPPDAIAGISRPSGWPHDVSRDWAWGGSEGRGARVCVLDSGVEREHPLVGEIQGAVVASVDEEGDVRIEPDSEGDLTGHGTACAGIIRSFAPACEIVSVRVLGAGLRGSGHVLLGALTWAIQQGFQVINLSLSTSKRDHLATLHELTDRAYFRRAVVVAAAHNMTVESYPWRFSSVVSVGSHAGTDPYEFFSNPDPPVEFFARGVDVEMPWRDGGRLVGTGNSFAAPHIAGICALILSKHPELTPFQLKSVLHLTAANVDGADG
jgi:subtilisin family serine protease